MLEIFGQIALQRMTAGHFVELASLLVEPHPQSPLLVDDVGHVDAAGCGHAGKGVHHHANQGAIPQPQHVIRLNRAQQLAGLLGSQHRCLALAELLAWRLHRERRVVFEESHFRLGASGQTQ
jgi:hypothetical protein